MNFSGAYLILRAGGHVARESWENRFLFLSPVTCKILWAGLKDVTGGETKDYIMVKDDIEASDWKEVD